MDDLPPEIAALVEEKRRADEPSAEDQARVGKSLATALGLPNAGWTGTEGADVAASSGATTTATSAVTSAVMSAGVKAALVVAAVVTGASAMFVWRGGAPVPDSRLQSMRARAASAAGSVAVAPFEPARSSPPRRALEPASDRRADAARPIMPEPRDNPTATPAQPVPSGARPNRAAMHVRKQRDGAQPTASPLGSPPMAAALDASEPSNTEQPASSAAQPEDVLEGELALIAEASRALDVGDATAAMKALETHRSRFGAGFLREERDALWIVALCKQGSAAEAAAARASFERRAPRSPLRVRIEKQCKDSGKP
jgi:hypothetical protein